MDNNHDQESSQDSSIVEMNNATSVLHKIAQMYAEQLMSDICLVVGDNRYPAHRVILCASSEVFQVMLMNPVWNECRESVIELKEDPGCSLVFPQFLKYLYDGKIRISIQSVMPMLSLADKYNVKDLVQLCVDYMMKHTAKASTQGYLISWLQYTIPFSYHAEVTEACLRFLKYNLDIVSQSKDFLDLDVNILIVLLQQNDLVLKSEYELFRYISTWLMHKSKVILGETALTDAEKTDHTIQMVEAIVSHVRFAMMTPTELSELLLKPVINLHKSFFVNRIAIGMSFHAGQKDCVAGIRNTDVGALQFTPRLYTVDIWGLSMTINEFEKVENYQNFVACFFSQSNLSENEVNNQDHTNDQLVAWEIEFYPRGIRFNRAKIINIFNIQAVQEIPEICLRTVRLRVICRENLKTDQKFKIGVLITGVQNKIPHIRTVHVRSHYFSSTNRVLNIDNLLPYDELEMSSIKLSSHLIGNERSTLSIQVIIAPMGCYSCTEAPDFDF